MVPDELDIENAKAVQETAKAIAKTAEVSQEFGKWLDKCLGTTPRDFVGIVLGDWLHERRLQRWARLRLETLNEFAARGLRIEDAVPINPKIATEFFQAATEEGSDEVQDLWAALLANAMDPNKRTSIRPAFITALKSFDPTDALLLGALGAILVDKKRPSKAAGRVIQWAQTYIQEFHGIELRVTEAGLSGDSLIKSGCAVGAKGGLTGLSNLGIELYLATRRSGNE